MSAKERAHRFRRVVREASCDASIEYELFGDYRVLHGRAAMKAILEDCPDVTAVFVASDEIPNRRARSVARTAAEGKERYVP
jgi:DNA-binding LacI/PurR family transcriptional regulator